MFDEDEEEINEVNPKKEKSHLGTNYFPKRSDLNKKEKLIHIFNTGGNCEHPQKYWIIKIENKTVIRICGICDKKLPIIKSK